jgi:hypothetical protein
VVSTLFKMKAFGKNKSSGSSPVRQYDSEEAAPETFLPETQNTYASIDVAASGKAANTQLDEYRG